MSGLRLRDATSDDAAFWAEVYTRLRPHAPVDPVVERYWWDRPSDTSVLRRFVVERGGRAVGVAAFEHPRWELGDDRTGFAHGDVLPEHREPAVLDAILAETEARLAAAGARRIMARAEEDDPLRAAVIETRGYVEDRRSRRWECDLVADRERLLGLTEESRARMRGQGVRLATLAVDGDRNTLWAIHRLTEDAAQDVPTTVPQTPESFDDFRRWLDAPDMHRERFWLARDAGGVLGVSVLAYPPVRGTVGTAWTATARAARGRGIARAVKCETLAQAIGLGVDRVRTGHDAANAPILHLNESLGYRPVQGAIKYLRDA